VDQAAFAHQEVLRQFRECGEVANLDRRVGLCPRGYRQEAPESGRFALHFAQILSVTLFENMPLQQAFLGSDYETTEDSQRNQLDLFDC
jgi:hypothetical protein